MTDAEPLLALDHVSQVYSGRGRWFTAIKDVSLELRRGEFVCLLGPSGCGKSTLLRIICGLQPPGDGKVQYRGVPLKGVNPHATIVFQSFALFPWLTVLDNVAVPLKARGMSESMRHARSIDLLDKVGLDGFESAFPRELSGGMRQKVGFARALAMEPELLCLDEPFSALDVLSAEALRRELLDLWSGGTLPTRAVLMVTHNIEEAVFMADRIVLMGKDPGRVVGEVNIDLPHPRNRKSPNFMAKVDRVYALLAGHAAAEIEAAGATAEGAQPRALPNISINDLIGLIERISASPGTRHDIYRLAEELKIESEPLLRLTDAAVVLGFATVIAGDISLSPLGEAFAEAGVLARKEIFASRMRKLALVKWLLGLLGSADRHQLPGEVVRASLELEFPAHEAKRQLETLVSWGRYSEAIAYDDNTGMIFLEHASNPAAPEPADAS